MRKGVVVNIEQTVQSIRGAIEDAELMAGCEINSVYVGIAGGHIAGINSHGVIAVKGGEVGQRDVERALDAARAEQPETYEALAGAFTRAHNLADAALGCEVDTSILGDSELALLRACEEGEGKVSSALACKDFDAACSALAALKEPIDVFFEDVMVMDENASLRENRLRLLNRFVGVFTDVADFGLMAKKAQK